MTEHDTLASLDAQSTGKTDGMLLQDRHSTAVPQFPMVSGQLCALGAPHPSASPLSASSLMWQYPEPSLSLLYDLSIPSALNVTC